MPSINLQLLWQQTARFFLVVGEKQQQGRGEVDEH